MQGHQLIDAALLLLFGDGVAKGFGRGPLFGRIGKAAHAVEAGIGNELLELFELGLALAGIANDEGGTDADIGELLAETVQKGKGLPTVNAALHGMEQTAVDVLQRYVDVVADVGVLAHGLDGVEGKIGGIGVVEAYPRGSAFSGQPGEEVAQTAATVEVKAVVGGVLRNDDYFFNARGDKVSGLVDKLVDGARDVSATDEGDGTVGAMAVAALGNFEVGIVARRGEGAFGGEGQRGRGFCRGALSRRGLLPCESPDVSNKFVPLVNAKPGGDLGQFGLELVAVALHKAARGYQCALAAVGMVTAVEIACSLQLGKEGVDGLLLGVADEAAGVEDYDVAVVARAVKEDGVARRAQVPRHIFGVDSILATAEGDDVDFH